MSKDMRLIRLWLLLSFIGTVWSEAATNTQLETNMATKQNSTKDSEEIRPKREPQMFDFRQSMPGIRIDYGNPKWQGVAPLSAVSCSDSISPDLDNDYNSFFQSLPPGLLLRGNDGAKTINWPPELRQFCQLHTNVPHLKTVNANQESPQYRFIPQHEAPPYALISINDKGAFRHSTYNVDGHYELPIGRHAGKLHEHTGLPKVQPNQVLKGFQPSIQWPPPAAMGEQQFQQFRDFQPTPSSFAKDMPAPVTGHCVYKTTRSTDETNRNTDPILDDGDNVNENDPKAVGEGEDPKEHSQQKRPNKDDTAKGQTKQNNAERQNLAQQSRKKTKTFQTRKIIGNRTEKGKENNQNPVNAVKSREKATMKSKNSDIPDVGQRNQLTEVTTTTESVTAETTVNVNTVDVAQPDTTMTMTTTTATTTSTPLTTTETNRTIKRKIRRKSKITENNNDRSINIKSSPSNSKTRISSRPSKRDKVEMQMAANENSPSEFLNNDGSNKPSQRGIANPKSERSTAAYDFDQVPVVPVLDRDWHRIVEQALSAEVPDEDIEGSEKLIRDTNGARPDQTNFLERIMTPGSKRAIRYKHPRPSFSSYSEPIAFELNKFRPFHRLKVLSEPPHYLKLMSKPTRPTTAPTFNWNGIEQKRRTRPKPTPPTQARISELRPFEDYSKPRVSTRNYGKSCKDNQNCSPFYENASLERRALSPGTGWDDDGHNDSRDETDDIASFRRPGNPELFGYYKFLT